MLTTNATRTSSTQFQLKSKSDEHHEQARNRIGHPEQGAPVKEYVWRDPETDAEGYLVYDLTTNNTSGGGIFMHSNATRQEVRDIAFNMSRKFTVTSDAQIGGAKLGIRFDHKDPRANEVLRRCINHFSFSLKEDWVTAGDLNTDDAFIESVINSDIGLANCQSTLGRKLAEATGGQDLSPTLHSICKHPATAYFPIIEAAVGSGVATSVDMAKRFAGLTGSINVVIQGFGAVGSSLAYYLDTRSIGKVVAISDIDGILYNNDGIDIKAVLAARQDAIATCSNPSKRTMLAKSCISALTVSGDEQISKFGSLKRGSFDMVDLVNSVSVEVHAVCPCAVRYAITEDAVKAIFDRDSINHPPKILVCGANNPYGFKQVDGSMVEDKSHNVYKSLIDAGVVVIPDFVANSGTAQLFHVCLTHCFTNASSPKHFPVDEILHTCDSRIQDFVSTAFDSFAQGDPILLAHACEVLAANRLKNPLPFSKSSIKMNASLSRSRYALPPMAGLAPPEERFAELKLFAEQMGCEVTSFEELLELLRTVQNPVAYDGFEPSGRMHIAQGMLKALLVNMFTKLGFTFVLWVADWFAKLNMKMGGDMDDIRTLGEYFIEVWKSCGMNTARVQFLWCEQEMSSHSDEYWSGVMNLSTQVTLKRTKRCGQAMGRAESDSLATSQIFYPIMQCNDIKFLGADVCQLGVDQRKVNMLAREQYATMGLERPPVIYSHPMLPGLRKGQAKMSKSDPELALWMEDSAEDIERKIKKAHCPPGSPTDNHTNPVLAYLRSIVFQFATIRSQAVEVTDTRSGALIGRYKTYGELETAYNSGAIHPTDLKNTLTVELNRLLEPTRRHFTENSKAAALRAKVIQIMERDAVRRAAAASM